MVQSCIGRCLHLFLEPYGGSYIVCGQVMKFLLLVCWCCSGDMLCWKSWCGLVYMWLMMKYLSMCLKVHLGCGIILYGFGYGCKWLSMVIGYMDMVLHSIIVLPFLVLICFKLGMFVQHAPTWGEVLESTRFIVIIEKIKVLRQFM